MKLAPKVFIGKMRSGTGNQNKDFRRDLFGYHHPDPLSGQIDPLTCCTHVSPASERAIITKKERGGGGGGGEACKCDEDPPRRGWVYYQIMSRNLLFHRAQFLLILKARNAFVLQIEQYF